MKKFPGNLLKNLEKSWNFVSPKKVGTLVIKGTVVPDSVADPGFYGNWTEGEDARP